MRDEFDRETKEVLARRVGLRCSNPHCRKLTSGPATDPMKALNIGVAAHITAASPGGPRYDPNQSTQERKSIANGIWLCQICGKLVDNDTQRYTAELLREWKQQAESSALAGVETVASNEFSQVLASLSRIESQLAVFGSSPGTDSDPNIPISSPNSEILRYVILGIEDESWLPWLQLFADPLPQDNSLDTVEEIYFDDLDEMQSVFATLIKVIEKANQVKDDGGNAQQAFEHALFEEGIARASRFFFPQQDTHAPNSTGLKYAIWGIRPDHANTIRVLRPQTMLGHSTSPIRDATEFFFENPAVIPYIPKLVGKAAEASNGDVEEFKRLLFESALRLRMLGPEPE